jgi:membrane-associated phospholipid phosphatase
LPSPDTDAPKRWGFYRGTRRGLALVALLIWLALLLLGGAGSGLDERLYAQLYAADNEVLAGNARLLSRLGSWTVLVPVSIVAAIFLAFARRQRAALLLIIVFGGRLLVEVQKILIDRDRPGVSPHLEAVHSMSFPSAHAANSMITYLAIGLLLPVSLRYRAVAVGIALALSLQIGWSRVALGVHWPSDVVAGWMFGIFWVMLCMRLASARPEAEAVAAAPKRGTLRGRASLLIRRRGKMDNRRADIARDHDDSNLIENMEPGPSHSGAHGGNLQRDIASRAEEQHDVDGKPGVTRVQDQDKPEQANLPRFNEGNHKLNP